MAETAQHPVPGDDDPRHNVVVVTCRGRDQSGICHGFATIAASRGCRVLDMAQFLLDGLLVFTVVLEVGKECSLAFLKELLEFGRRRDLKLDFYFPQNVLENTSSVDGNEAVLVIVSASDILPSLVHELDAVLSDYGCIVNEIEHRSDNKVENTGNYSKMQMRFTCPEGLKLSSLYVGAPGVSSESDCYCLRKIAQDHGVVITVRWWDAMNRLNGKSLVVFELSRVLCPYHVLNEVLKEAGVDPSTIPVGETPFEELETKIKMLKGKSVDIVDRLIGRLELTKGARVVCSTLKALGVRQAILTSSGVREVAEFVKRQLDLDYVICQSLAVENGCFTGEQAGEVSDVRFRKSDLLKLMAARENIDPRNVIVVGEFMRGLSSSSARQMLDDFGPNVHFNAEQFNDLTMALFSLGFNGSHVHELERRCESVAEQISFCMPQRSDACGPLLPGSTSRYKAQISSQKKEPGQIKRIISSLLRFTSVVISTIRQCSLQDGGMCLGLELALDEQDKKAVIQELLYLCRKEGLQLDDARRTPTLTSELDTKLATPNWKHYFENRHVLTVVQKPWIKCEGLRSLFGSLSNYNVNILKIERLSARDMFALQFAVNLPANLDEKDLSDKLFQISKEEGMDIAFQKDDVDRWMRRLVVFDMDSTLIQQEVIDELAKYAGVEAEVKSITEAAMRGELNFLESLKSRVALLKGHNADELFARVKRNLVFTPGAKQLCSTLKRLGYKLAVISGGFLPVAEEVQRELGLDYAFANTLEIDERTRLLTGCTSGPVVTPERKRALLLTIATVEGCTVSQTIAVGDGANDIPMLNTAGLGIAFCAKPKVQAATEFRINQLDLSTVLFLIGLSEHASERLSANRNAMSRAHSPE